MNGGICSSSIYPFSSRSTFNMCIHAVGILLRDLQIFYLFFSTLAVVVVVAVVAVIRHTTIDFICLENNNCIVVVRNHSTNWTYLTLGTEQKYIPRLIHDIATHFTKFLCTIDIFACCFFHCFVRIANAFFFFNNIILINYSKHPVSVSGGYSWRSVFTVSVFVRRLAWMRNFYVWPLTMRYIHKCITTLRGFVPVRVLFF